MSALESFDSRPLSDRLVESVREIILSGEMSPDEPIRQDSLAARLHVSKIPLRDSSWSRTRPLPLAPRPPQRRAIMRATCSPPTIRPARFKMAHRCIGPFTWR